MDILDFAISYVTLPVSLSLLFRRQSSGYCSANPASFFCSAELNVYTDQVSSAYVVSSIVSFSDFEIMLIFISSPFKFKSRDMAPWKTHIFGDVYYSFPSSGPDFLYIQSSP